MSGGVARGRSNAVAGCRHRAATFVIFSLSGYGTFAQESDSFPILLAQAHLAAPTDRNMAQFEVSSSSLPRFDNTDGSSHSSSVDMKWLPPRRSALGLSLGMTSLDGPILPPLTPFASRPALAPNSVNLGLHWRYALHSNYRLDVTAWRRMVPPDALTLVQTREPSYGARVEMQLGNSLPASGFVAERGFLGLQLEGDARVTLRRSGGKPMVYYRTKF